MPNNAYQWPTWLINSLTNKYKNPNRKFNYAQNYLWQALNIYDDLIDGDNPQADMMEANHSFRKFLNVIYSAGLPPLFIAEANKTITAWENISRQERLNPRLKINDGLLPKSLKLPDLKPEKNYQKSAPLAIAPIALAIKTGLLKTSLEIKYAFKFFKFALSAKQLADDASDWLDDLQEGIINPVNLLVLRAAKNKKIRLNLQTKPEIAYLLFADSAGPQTAKTIIYLGKKAKQAASKLNISENSPLVHNLVSPLVKAAEKVLNFQKML